MYTRIKGFAQRWALSGALAILALLILVAGAGASAPEGVALAVGYTPTLSTDVSKLWRKVQGKLMEGFNFMCEEWEAMDEIKKFDIDLSTREITVPVDTDEDGGVASIAEGGWQAFPTSAAPREITLAFIQTSARYSVSGLTKYLEQENPQAQITSQIAYQGKKKLQAVAAWWSDMFYGYTTGVRALVSGNPGSAGSHTLTLKDGYGNSGFDTAAQLAKLFRPGRDKVALVRSAALVTNSFGGTVDSRSTTNGTITVTWPVGNVDPADGDEIVLANAMYDSAGALAQTDYNRGITGLLEATQATSVHSLSGGDVEQWNASLNDSSGGRFTGVRFHKGNDEVGNKGGGQINCLYMAQGVYRDMLDNYQAAVRYSDPFMMEVDGKVKIEGVEFKRTRRVPSGWVFGLDRSAFRRLPNILNKPKARAQWPDAEKLQNRDAYAFELPFIGGNVVTNRANMAAWSGLSEQ